MRAKLNQLSGFFGFRVVDGQRNFWQVCVRLGQRLQNQNHIAARDRFFPERPKYFPPIADSMHLAPLQGQAHFACAFVAKHQLHRHSKGRVQEPRGVVPARSRSCCRHARRGFLGHPLFNAVDAAGFGEAAGDLHLGHATDVLKSPRVESNPSVPSPARETRNR